MAVGREVRMKLLLDTHIVFWSLTNDPRLERRHREAILDEAGHVGVSAVTGWELD